MDRPAFAPWLPPRKPKRCIRLRWSLGCLGSLLLLVYVLIVGLLWLICQLPGLVVSWLMAPALRRFGYVVEYAYSLRICRLHVTIERIYQRLGMGRPYHSRCVDIRSELPLDPDGMCFVHPLPCMTANFAYLLVDASKGATEKAETQKEGLRCCIVDPCDATAVIELVEHLAVSFYAEYGGLTLEAVLCTHKHWDHAGGNTDLRKWAEASNNTSKQDAGPTRKAASLRFADELRVYGGYDDAIPGRTHPIEDGATFWVAGLEFEALATPGHTEGSMVFCIKNLRRDPSMPDTSQVALFTGDCLFSGGCGAPFEGSELDMEHCFASILRRCELDSTLLFPGHEYSVMLLEDRLIKPERSSMEGPPGQFLSLCADFYTVSHRRSLHDKLPTVPCTIAGERQISPLFHMLKQRAEVILSVLEERFNCECQRGTRQESRPDDLAPLPLHLTSAYAEGIRRRKSTTSSNSFGIDPVIDTEHFFTAKGRSHDFAFVYRSELDLLRIALKDGSMTGPEAADKLTELERRVFEAPVLTGNGDSFDDEGIQDEPDGAEERESAGETSTIMQHAAPVAGAESSKTLKELRAQRVSLSKALRVLGVPGHVPLGRKTPCNEELLPISLPRLLALLRRLGVRKTELFDLLSKAVDGNTAGFNSTSLPGSNVIGGANGPMTSSSDDRRPELLPLRQLLQLLCPVPEEDRCTSVIRKLRKARNCCPPGMNCVLKICCCRRHDQESAQEQPQESSEQDLDYDADRETRKQFARQEKQFTKHNMKKCPVCCGSYAVGNYVVDDASLLD